MKHFAVVGILAIVVVLAGVYFFGQLGKVSYVADIQTEVEKISSELAALDKAVLDGTLTPEAAYDARVRIVTRLESIDVAVAASEHAELTVAQRQQLFSALDTLKRVLTDYRGTLVAVDTVAVKHRADTGSDGEKTLTDVLSDTIETLEEHTDIVAEEYGDLDELRDDEVDGSDVDTADEDHIDDSGSMDGSEVIESTETSDDQPAIEDDGLGDQSTSTSTDEEPTQ